MNPEGLCPTCDAPVATSAKFCAICGAALGTAEPAGSPPTTVVTTRDRRRRRTRRARSDDSERSVHALAIVFGGLLVALVTLFLWGPNDRTAELALTGVELTLGLTAILALGSGAWRASFAGLATATDFGYAVAIAAVTAAFSWGFVESLVGLVGVELLEEGTTPFDLLMVIAVAPLLEEWLCRGVLWRALEPFSTPNERIASTAVLFGMLHCTGGLLAFPHRFVAGIGFGWLRERSGSLLPCILAHALHNLIITLLPSV